jgi:hypothetical protein
MSAKKTEAIGFVMPPLYGDVTTIAFVRMGGQAKSRQWLPATIADAQILK